MITLEHVTARRPPLSLADVSLAWGPGVHCLVGAHFDGGPMLLRLVAGAARPRSGRVRVLGGSPMSVTVRRQVAFVPLDRTLPEAMRVRDILTIAADIRGEPRRDAARRLEELGLQTLASRAVQTLSQEETRAVALAEAVTSSQVRVLLMEEPFVALDPRAATRLPDVLRARARDGWAVLIATASIREAAELGDDHLLLRGGGVVGQESSLEALTSFSSCGTRLRILASDPRSLVVALAREAGVEAVARRDAGVVARGRDALDLARAANRAILACGADVTEMRTEPPSLDEARAAAGRAP